jgi:hypothetical protein
VALGGVHVRPSPVAVVLLGVCAGALRRPAFRLLALRRHRSSDSMAFNSAYHLTIE